MTAKAPPFNPTLGTQGSIPTTFDPTPFRTYTSETHPELKLLHFISESNEINVSSSIVMGEKEAIVFTAQATKYAAERLADVIADTGRKLTYIFLDHAHLDHSQGASVLVKRFPDAKCIAEPRVAALQQARMKADDEMAAKRYGTNAAIPSVPFEAFNEDVIMLENKYEIQLWKEQYGDVGIGLEDEPHTVCYIPALGALLPNDICYFGAHMMMGGSTKASRQKWIEQVEHYQTIDNLQVVIPGHIPRSWSSPDKFTAEACLSYSLKYLRDYDQAMEECTSSDEVIVRMLQLYPKQEHLSALYLGAFLNFTETHRLLFNPTLEKIVAWFPKSFVQWADAKLYAMKKNQANPPHACMSCDGSLH